MATGSNLGFTICDVSNQFGLGLRRLREAAGFTVGDLAERAGINGSYLSMLENGKRRMPSHDVMASLARALNIDLEDFFRATGVIPYRESPDLIEQEANLMFYQYKNLTPRGREVVQRFIEFTMAEDARRAAEEARQVPEE